MSDDEIYHLILTQVTIVVKDVIPELFRSIKTTLIDMIDECHVAITNVPVATTTVFVAATGH